MTGPEHASADKTSEKAIRIVLADDHQVVRRGLQLVLGEEPDVEVVAQADDVRSARRHVSELRPDVLVIDFNMPGGSVLESIPEIRVAFPATQIVMLTMQKDPHLAQQVLRADARAYVLKEEADTELVLAVRRAAAGETYVSRELAGRLAAERIRASGWD